MLRRLLTVLVASAALSHVRADSSTNRFGFGGPEVFPLDFGIGFLHVADIDGDGLNDIVVVNNGRSKITFLYNGGDEPEDKEHSRSGKTNAPATAAKVGRRDINELPAEARFRVESISSEKRITSMVVADLNGDGLVNGIDLGIQLGNWGPTPPGSGIALGDLNRDGIVDGADLGRMLAQWGTNGG